LSVALIIQHAPHCIVACCLCVCLRVPSCEKISYHLYVIIS